MKSIKSFLAVILIALAGLAGCNDNFDTPPLSSPVANYNPEYLITIEEFKNMYWQDENSYIDTVLATDNYPELYIKGRVISSDESGNIYKSLVIQDETAALAMSINQNSLYNTYRPGQEIVISLVGMYIGKYAGLMQLGEPQLYQNSTWQATFMSYEFFQEHSQISGWPVIADIDTINLTIGALPSTPEGLRKYQSQLVRFTDVHWTEPGQVYATYQTNTNRTIADDNGGQLTVRNSGYANFRSQLIPEGVGTVVGILSYFNNGWQLLLNSTADVSGFEPASTDGTKEVPYTVVRAIELQGRNKEGWVEGYIVGALKPGVNESVSSNDDVQWGAPTVLDNTIVIGATADTKSIAEALVVELPDGSLLQKYGNLADNADVYKKKIILRGTLSPYLGQPGVTTTGASGTFEIEGVTIGGETGDGLASGDGTEEKPYNCAQIIAKKPADKDNALESDVWTHGYIVGWIDGMTYSSGCRFNATATSKTNLLLADTPTETDPAKCIPIALPNNNLRTELNLQEHPENYGKVLSYKGDIIKYFGVPGLKNGSDYTIDGEGGNPGGGDTPQGDVLYSFSFLGDANNGGFTADDKVKPSQLSQIWVSDSRYGWKASAFESATKVCYASESWLISPAFNIPAEGATLSFEHVLFKGDQNQVGVYVSTDKNDWKALSIPNWSDGNSWTFVSSGAISLGEYAGKTIYIAYKYSSSTSVAGTWEIKNFLITK